MRLLLPEPYPDELLASVVARHQAHLGSDLWDGPLQRSVGRSHPFAIDLPDDLERLGRSAGERFGHERVSAEMTLAPFYMAYKPPERVEAVRAVMRVGRGDGASKAAGVGQSRLSRPRHLRFCPSCREADLKVLGETYWRRTHQLACALVCPDHGEVLVPTDELMLRPSSKRLADATAATSRPVDTGLPEPSWDVDLATDLARRGRERLEGNYGAWPRERVARGYAPELRKRGYARAARGVDTERVGADMIDMFGSALLEAIGGPFDATRHAYWFKLALRPIPGSLSTTEHLLLQAFIETRQILIVEAVDSFGGPWRCNNPHAGHDGPTISSLESSTNPDGSHRWVGRCPCGQSFSFRRTLDGAPDTPLVTRNYTIGTGWREAVLEAAGERISIAALAARTGLSEHWVRRIIAEGPGHDELRAAAILDRRRRWDDLLSAVPGRNRALARRLDPSLYKLMRRTDREWLYRTPRNTASTKVRKTLDWGKVDEDAAAGIIAAGEEMGRDPTAPRLTAPSLARSSGLSMHRLYPGLKAGRLPRTAAAVAAFAESLQAYHARKLRQVARSMVESGVRPSVRRLRRATGLQPSRYSTAEYKALYERALAEVEVDGPS